MHIACDHFHLLIMYEKYLNSRGMLNHLLGPPNSLKLFKTIIQNPKIFWGSAHSPRFAPKKPQQQTLATLELTRFVRLFIRTTVNIAPPALHAA